MFVPQELEQLADIFKKHKSTLYVVGGYVRSHLMGIGIDGDIDLASSAKPHDIIKMLVGTSYSAKIMNETAGVVEIVVGAYRFEHATFRTESYAIAGEHMPKDVQFISDINEDARRRDFTCNAIYYDIESEQIVDPLGGFNDIKNKQLRACVPPQYLFKNDAERILRMVRIASSCGYQIEEKTYKVAAENAFRLKFLSNARKRKELNRILLADMRYPSLNLAFAQVRAVEMLREIGALKYLFPALSDALDVNAIMPNKLSAEEYFNILLQFSTPNTRLPSLLALCGTDGYAKNGKVRSGFSIESAQEAEYQLKKLEYSNETIRVAVCCILNFEKLSKDSLSLADCRELSITNYNQMDELEDFSIVARSAFIIDKATNSKSLANIRLALKQYSGRLFAVNSNQLRITNSQILEIKELDAKQLANLKFKLLLMGARKGRPLTNKENIKLARKLLAR